MDPAWLRDRLRSPALELGVAVPGDAVPALAGFTALLLDWGSRVNLTGARTREALADDHLADALALLPHLPEGAFDFVDVGSGGGLPGLLLAILRPDARGALLEPIRKKHTFLAEALRALGLSSRVEAKAERLEAHLSAGNRGRYDVATSRAVWPAGRWLAQGSVLVKSGGLVLGLEGATPTDLPAGAERHSYTLHGRKRAVVSLRR